MFSTAMAAMTALLSLCAFSFAQEANAGSAEIHARCTPKFRYKKSRPYYGSCSIAAVPGGGRQFHRFLKASDTVAIKGACLRPIKNLAQADAIIEKANVDPVGAKPEERIALAKGLQRILEMSPGGFSAIDGAVMRFYTDSARPKKSGMPFGRQNRAGFIEIHRNGNQPDTNVVHLMHELAHWVGHQEDLYHAYKSEVPHCQISSYCRHVGRGQPARNEEFAEVFAAFITHPELLQNSPNCKKAYAFWAKSSNFPKGRQLAKCDAAERPGTSPLSGDRSKIVPLPPPRPANLKSHVATRDSVH